MEDVVRTLALSPVDHVFTGPGSYPISFAIAYDRILDPARLQRSLKKALRDFWPLRARLTRLSSHAYAFRPDDDGLLFEVVNSPDAFADSADCGRYVSPVDSVLGKPLTKIRLTQTPKGSVLGVSISHALVDGFSFFHFLSSWARIAQGQRILRPSHRRELLMAETLNCEDSITADDFLTQCGLFLGGHRRDSEIASIDEESLSLSPDRMRELRAEAQSDCDAPLFDNDVITAHIWREYGARWAHIDYDPTTFVTVPFDFRRLLVEVPRTYFGCALAFATASMTYDRLTSASLGEVSYVVRRSVAHVDSDYVRGSLRALETLRRSKGLSGIEAVEVRHPQRGLIVTNISRLPVSSIDFGWGSPVSFSPIAPTQRGVAILPSDTGVSIRVFPPAMGDSTEGDTGAT